MPKKDKTAILDLTKIDNNEIKEEVVPILLDYLKPKVTYHNPYAYGYDAYDDYYNDDWDAYDNDFYNDYQFHRNLFDYDDDADEYDDEYIYGSYGSSKKGKKKTRRGGKKHHKKSTYDNFDDVDTIWPNSDTYDDYPQNVYDDYPQDDEDDDMYDDSGNRTLIYFYWDVTREDEFERFTSLFAFDEFLQDNGFHIDNAEAVSILERAESHVTEINGEVVSSHSFGDLYWNVVETRDDAEDVDYTEVQS